MRERLPKSLRKHIRTEKARIRREVLDFKKQQELINELYQKFSIPRIKAREKERTETG